MAEGTDAEEGDYVEFCAERDVLIVLSLCPNGSSRMHGAVREQDIKPPGVEICSTGIRPLEFEDVLAD